MTKGLTLAIALLGASGAAAFTVDQPTPRSSLRLAASIDDANYIASCSLRRSVIQGAAAVVFTIPAMASAETGAEVRGTPLTPFNSLAYQYRGVEYGGLKASDLDEPSVSYKDFIERLKKGEVDFVEFMAPHGDAAYATFKGEGGSIRIGEGYPTEQFDGWSSPAFAVRTVKDAGVPYKFTVPALKVYKN